jgi:hypothetical protein
MLLLLNTCFSVEKASKGYDPDLNKPHVENDSKIMMPNDMIARSLVHMLMTAGKPPPQVTMAGRVPAATERRARTCLTTGLFQNQDTRLK